MLLHLLKIDSEVGEVMCSAYPRTLVFLLWSFCFGVILSAHDGPDPLMHWQMKSKNLRGKTIKARLGPDLQFASAVTFQKDPLGESVRFSGRGFEGVVAEDLIKIMEYLPTKSLTVSAWVAVEEPVEWGGIVGVMQDNGDHETGWVLGYTDSANFSFSLSTKRVDDGNGKMTCIKGKTQFELGKIYHVAAIYDGNEMQLFVNGKLDASSKEQSGEILYPKSAPFVIGSYRDKNEFFPLKGRIREVAIFDIAAETKWVKEEFDHHSDLSKLPKLVREDRDNFVVQPYLQYGTKTGMTIMWRAAKAGPGTGHWGENKRCKNQVDAKKESVLQEVRIEGLQPETQYFYWVESVDSNGNKIESEVSTFQTASQQNSPFAFAVISDTQGNPRINGTIARLAWDHRPNFLLHPGDLVDRGIMHDDWIDEFFASMHVLISRVPMYPVLGNHEMNARNYFNYMSLPEPEYYYQFSYGNADFFMIDSNRKVDPNSEQYEWLEDSLGKSKAEWKFVCHHHPPYSSDENDYGNLWRTNKSTRGDPRMRQLVPLYDKHQVDVVWTGHIHSYERTWSLRNHQPVNQDGTIYMITGGGGGSLESPGPFRPYFQNNVRHGHHYVIVAINGKELELKTFSLKNHLIDNLRIVKQ